MSLVKASTFPCLLEAVHTYVPASVCVTTGTVRTWPSCLHLGGKSFSSWKKSTHGLNLFLKWTEPFSTLNTIDIWYNRIVVFWIRSNLARKYKGYLWPYDGWDWVSRSNARQDRIRPNGYFLWLRLCRNLRQGYKVHWIQDSAYHFYGVT